MSKPDICLCENKGADQLCSNCTAAQLISAFVFATQIVLIFSINLKLHDSIYIHSLQRLICVRPGGKINWDTGLETLKTGSLMSWLK